jgi:hypothetical protein
MKQWTMLGWLASVTVIEIIESVGEKVELSFPQ